MGRGSVFGLRLVGLAHVGRWVGLCLCVGVVGALCGLAGLGFFGMVAFGGRRALAGSAAVFFLGLLQIVVFVGFGGSVCSRIGPEATR